MQHRMRGFSLLETMVVLAIIFVVTGMSVMTLQPALQSQRVTNAYNTTLMTMRQARDTAVAQRQTYFVTFTHNTVPPDIITVTQGATGTVVSTLELPLDLSFQTLNGIPTGAGTTPDNFGLGGTAIDFDQNVAGGAPNVIYFMPDGSGQDSQGNINNGVIYIARAGELYSSRAITFWGATGRMRGWRLLTNKGTPYWRQM
ncbi:MAG: prepilin-type N-terminal cleavage/methylation domain-containing protein [Terriglobales bacterium]